MKHTRDCRLCRYRNGFTGTCDYIIYRCESRGCPAGEGRTRFEPRRGRRLREWYPDPRYY